MKRLCKCLLAMLLLAAITLPMGGCSFSDLFGSSSDHTTGQQGSQGSGQTNSQGSGDEPAEKKPDYSMYSPLLQEVLSDPEYDELYRRYERGEIREYGGGFDGGVNLLEAIPYGYLTSKGEDIEGIQNGTVGVTADLYTTENDKNHIYNRLEVIYVKNNDECYINLYLLKYETTEQEIEDFTMLYKGDYFQGPIMFQHLASKQTPKMISEFAITEKAYEGLLGSLNKNEVVKQNFGNTVSNYIVTYFTNNAEDARDYDLCVKLISANSYNSVSNGCIADMSAKVDHWAKPTYSNGIINWTSIHQRYIDEQIEPSTPITYFQLYHSFKNFKERW